MRKRLRFILIFLVLASLAGIASYFYYTQQSKPSTLTMPPLPVELGEVNQQTLPISITAMASLSALHQVDISPEINGQIANVGFTDGQDVEKGQLLFQLDDEIAKAQLSAAQAKLTLDKDDLHRAKRLYKQRALSQNAVEQAEESYLESASSVREKKATLDKMQLIAPFAGKLTSRTVSAGQYVAVGQTLVSLVDINQLNVVYHVNEDVLPQLKLGQKVRVTSSAETKHVVTGTVSYLSPVVDQTTRTVEVHATVMNKQDLLSPGMFVQVSQVLQQHQNALVIPAQAIVATVDGSKVYIYNKGRAVEKSVTIGQRMKDSVEILSGLNVNDEIIIAGQQQLRDGSKVVVTSAVQKGSVK